MMLRGVGTLCNSLRNDVLRPFGDFPFTIPAIGEASCLGRACWPWRQAAATIFGSQVCLVALDSGRRATNAKKRGSERDQMQGQCCGFNDRLMSARSQFLGPDNRRPAQGGAAGRMSAQPSQRDRNRLYAIWFRRPLRSGWRGSGKASMWRGSEHVSDPLPSEPSRFRTSYTEGHRD